MAGISTSIAVRDNFSAALGTMAQSLNICLSGFADLQAASGKSVDVANIQAARAAMFNMENAAAQLADEINEAGSQQQKFNNHVVQGTSGMNGLARKAASVVAAYASIQTVKGIVGASDELALTTARLDLMNGGLQTTEKLQDMIFQAAENSRAAYSDTASAVAKMGTLAGKAFSSTAEIVKFTELMNKNFVVGGSSATEQASAMYQLTQAMAAGKLQGDEYRSIIENAPLLASAIEDYMVNVEHAQGTMKDWAADGLLTADVIRAAVFNTADDIDSRLASMPMTWGQVATSIQNQALRAFQPILTKINEIANTEKFQTMSTGIVNGLRSISTVASQAFDGMVAVGSWVYDTWTEINPIVWGVVGAIGAYLIIQTALGAITAINTAGTVAYTIALMAKSVAMGIVAFMTGNAALAQTALNTAMLVSPIGWILLLIGVLVVALVRWIQSVGDLKLAWLIAMDNIKTKMEEAHIKIMQVINGVVDYLDMLGMAFKLVGSVVADYMGDMKVKVLMTLQNMINGCIELINDFIEILNKIPGVNIEAVTAVSTIGTDAAETEARKKAQRIAEFNSEYEEMQRRAANRASDLANLQAGYTIAQAQRDNEIANRKNEIASGVDAANPYGDINDYLSNIANSTANGADSTDKIADSLEITEENLKYLRDIAEREIIDRTVFKSVNVDLGGVSNTVNNMADLDGIADYLGDVISQTASASMEGY